MRVLRALAFGKVVLVADLGFSVFWEPDRLRLIAFPAAALPVRALRRIQQRCEQFVFRCPPPRPRLTRPKPRRLPRRREPLQKGPELYPAEGSSDVPPVPAMDEEVVFDCPRVLVEESSEADNSPRLIPELACHCSSR